MSPTIASSETQPGYTYLTPVGVRCRGLTYKYEAHSIPRKSTMAAASLSSVVYGHERTKRPSFKRSSGRWQYFAKYPVNALGIAVLRVIRTQVRLALVQWPRDRPSRTFLSFVSPHRRNDWRTLHGSKADELVPHVSRFTSLKNREVFNARVAIWILTEHELSYCQLEFVLFIHGSECEGELRWILMMVILFLRLRSGIFESRRVSIWFRWSEYKI